MWSEPARRAHTDTGIKPRAAAERVDAYAPFGAVIPHLFVPNRLKLIVPPPLAATATRTGSAATS